MTLQPIPYLLLELKQREPTHPTLDPVSLDEDVVFLASQINNAATRVYLAEAWREFSPALANRWLDTWEKPTRME